MRLLIKVIRRFIASFCNHGWIEKSQRYHDYNTGWGVEEYQQCEKCNKIKQSNGHEFFLWERY
jgi:hypothetical protein